MSEKCVLCGAMSEVKYEYGFVMTQCPDCGRWIMHQVKFDRLSIEQKNKIKSYIFYHKKEKGDYFIGTENEFKDYQACIVPICDTQFLSLNIVNAWYPKTFADKIDLILLKLAEFSNFQGDYVTISNELLFADSKSSETISENYSSYIAAKFIIDYLEKENLIKVVDAEDVQLLPKAWSRIYELQKSHMDNKNVFVAMKFGKETEALRDKIKEGLAGYNVRIMDEIEHNHQIIPEMLYEIKNSKFVIAELSHHNNGAYYEAGYALGLGKEVIHICSESELKSGLHFDVAQVNTIVYSNISEIPEKLKRRIQATIENK